MEYIGEQKMEINWGVVQKVDSSRMLDERKFEPISMNEAIDITSIIMNTVSDQVFTYEELDDIDPIDGYPNGITFINSKSNAGIRKCYYKITLICSELPGDEE